MPKKTIKCPKCKTELNELVNVQSGYARYSMNKNGKYSNTMDSFDTDDRINLWECPDCGEVIATNEEDAIKFLNKRIKT